MRTRKPKRENRGRMGKTGRVQVMGSQGVKGQGVGSEEGGGAEGGRRSKGLMTI